MDKVNEKKIEAKKDEKVYKQSGIAIACYVIAAALLVYACYTAGATVKQINEYYSGYGMTATPKEYVTYVLQSVLDPAIRALLIFMAGYVLTAVRKLDPKNYKERKAVEAVAVAEDNAPVAAAASAPVKKSTASSKKAADETVDFEMKTEAKADAKKDSKPAPKKPAAKKPAAGKPAAKKDADKAEKDGAKKETKTSEKKPRSTAKKAKDAAADAKDKAKDAAADVKEKAAEKAE